MSLKKLVAVGCESSLKLRASSSAFDALKVPHIVYGCNVPSGVSIQPVGLKEMEIGAINRAEAALRIYPEADFAIGVENGLVPENQRWFDVPCVVIRTNRRWKTTAFGTYFPIPSWVAQKVFDQKTELGEVVKQLSGDGEKDPMKYFSEGKVLREDIIALAIQCALVPILFPHLSQD